MLRWRAAPSVPTRFYTYGASCCWTMPPSGRVESKCMNNGRSRRMRYTMPKTMSPQVGVPDRKVAHRYVEVYPGAHVAAVDDGGLSVHRLHCRTVRARSSMCCHRRGAAALARFWRNIALIRRAWSASSHTLSCVPPLLAHAVRSRGAGISDTPSASTS